MLQSNIETKLWQKIDEIENTIDFFIRRHTNRAIAV